MLRSVILSTFLLLWQFTTTIETLLVEPFNTQSPWSWQNHVATCIRWFVCLSIFEFVPEALSFIYTYGLGNTPIVSAWHERLHTLHIHLLTRQLIIHNRLIYPHTLHVHISTYNYTPGINAHNLADVTQFIQLHDWIYTYRHFVYTHIRTIYTYSYPADTYTHNIYSTYALRIDN